MESEINYLSTHAGAALAWLCVLIIAGLALFPVYELNRYGFIDYMTDKTGKFWGLIVMETLCLSGSFLIGRYLIHAKKIIDTVLWSMIRVPLFFLRTEPSLKSFCTQNYCRQMKIIISISASSST